MREIVGVIGDVQQGLGMDAVPEVYAPMAQNPFGTMFVVVHGERFAQNGGNGSTRGDWVWTRTRRSITLRCSTIFRAVRRDSAIRRATPRRLCRFGGAAGLPGRVRGDGLTQLCSARTKLGVRIALGAEANLILRGVLGRGFLLSLIGVAIGLTVSFSLAPLLSSLLYGVRAKDPENFALASLALIAVAAIASYIPARRAARVDPYGAAI